MANTLQTNLDVILAEKQAKILSENIKSGIQVFDITGSLEVGMTPEEEFAANETALQILGTPTNLLHVGRYVNFVDNNGKINDNFTLLIKDVTYQDQNQGTTEVLFDNYELDSSGSRVEKYYTFTEMLALCPFVTVVIQFPTSTTAGIYSASSCRVILSKDKPKRVVMDDYEWLETMPRLDYDQVNTTIYNFTGETTNDVFYENENPANLSIGWDGYNTGSGEYEGKMLNSALDGMNDGNLVYLNSSHYSDKSAVIFTNYII